MNNLVNTIEIYSDLMTSNNHEKENLKEYLIENIKDKSFRNEFVNEINDFYFFALHFLFLNQVIIYNKRLLKILMNIQRKTYIK